MIALHTGRNKVLIIMCDKHCLTQVLYKLIVYRQRNIPLPIDSFSYDSFEPLLPPSAIGIRGIDVCSIMFSCMDAACKTHLVTQYIKVVWENDGVQGSERTKKATR